MEDRQLYRVLDQLDSVFESPYLRPRNLRHRLQCIMVCFFGEDLLNCDTKVQVDAHFISRLQLDVGEFGAAFEDSGLRVRFAADAESSIGQHVGDSHDRPGIAVPEFPDDDECVVQQHAVSVFEFGGVQFGCEVCVVFGAADDDACDVLLGQSEQCSDAIGR